jgi:Transglycosylase SLT domain
MDVSNRVKTVHTKIKMLRGLILFLAGLTLLFGQITFTTNHEIFEPAHRLSGIGVDRNEVSDAVITKRTELMIESQTFSVMRDPRALAGAQRITGPGLQMIFASAAKQSGLTPGLIAAVAFLESFGDPKAQSPAGPRGIMQFSQATARAAGLKVVLATRYRTVSERKKTTVKGKTVIKVVAHKTPYEVIVRDDRLTPELAVPAAANYIARMQSKYGGIDLAIFAYHCGEGCVSDFVALAKQSPDFKKEPVTVPRLFFTASPIHNRDIYQRIKEHMLRDYSPTYYFRIRRAEELIALYKEDPGTFKDLFEAYKNPGDPTKRANDRLAVWLKPQDVIYKSCEDLRREEGKSLAKVDNKPTFFGFQLRLEGPNSIGSWDLKNREYYQQASPSAVGTLAYIAFETRRLFDAMKPKGEKFEPLEVTALVRTLDMTEGEMAAHCTGQVFDVAYADIPPHEKEALDFILDDIGWDGYLGFVQEMTGTLHIGCSPSSREFFTSVYQDMIDKKHES